MLYVKVLSKEAATKRFLKALHILFYIKDFDILTKYYKLSTLVNSEVLFTSARTSIV